MIAVQQNGSALQYASDELKNDKEVVMIAVQQNGSALYYASDKLKSDKEAVLAATVNNVNACFYFSLLEGYQDFDEIVEKESEGFLLSCCNNKDYKTRLQVANHHNFLPTLEQIEIGLKDWDEEVKNVYQLRKDEWLAKIEENNLRNTV